MSARKFLSMCKVVLAGGRVQKAALTSAATSVNLTLVATPNEQFRTSWITMPTDACVPVVVIPLHHGYTMTLTSVLLPSPASHDLCAPESSKPLAVESDSQPAYQPAARRRPYSSIHLVAVAAGSKPRTAYCVRQCQAGCIKKEWVGMACAHRTHHTCCNERYHTSRAGQ